MEIIKNHDNYLNPPEFPTHSLCDNCKEIFDNDDLNKTGEEWLCDECLRARS